MNNAPKPTFLIDGFLQKDVITAIAAPVGQRKTIVACNAVHAVLTGEPLFGPLYGDRAGYSGAVLVPGDGAAFLRGQDAESWADASTWVRRCSVGP